MDIRPSLFSVLFINFIHSGNSVRVKRHTVKAVNVFGHNKKSAQIKKL